MITIQTIFEIVNLLRTLWNVFIIKEEKKSEIADFMVYGGNIEG